MDGAAVGPRTLCAHRHTRDQSACVLEEEEKPKETHPKTPHRIQLESLKVNLLNHASFINHHFCFGQYNYIIAREMAANYCFYKIN